MRTLVLLLTLALLAVAVPATAGSVAPEPVCVPTNGGGMDYHSEACVDADNGGCRVWHDRHTGSGFQRTCYVPV